MAVKALHVSLWCRRKKKQGRDEWKINCVMQQSNTQQYDNTPRTIFSSSYNIKYPNTHAHTDTHTDTCIRIHTHSSQAAVAATVSTWQHMCSVEGRSCHHARPHVSGERVACQFNIQIVQGWVRFFYFICRNMGGNKGGKCNNLGRELLTLYIMISCHIMYKSDHFYLQW